MQATSLYNGLQGLKTHEMGLTSVADNLANVSTKGFKSTRLNFEDIMASKMAIGSPSTIPSVSQVGNGSTADSQNMMLQGSMEYTGNSLDMGIQGAGFFTLSNSDTSDTYYTRAGQFMVDDEGYVVDDNGLRLQGFVTAADGTVSGGSLTDILVPLSNEQATATSDVEIGVNLDAADTKKNDDAVAIDPSSPGTFNYSATATIYDENGVAHNITTYYQQLSGYRRVWKAATFENDSGTVSANPAAGNTFYLHFDTDGKLVGTSTTLPTTDSWIYSPMFSDSSDAVSDQLGETLSFTSNAVTQTYVTTADIDIAATYGENEVISIGSDSYDLATIVTAGDNNTTAAEKLAQSINGSASDYWATVNGSTVTVHSDGAAAVDVSAASDPDITISFDSMDDVIGAVNSGVAASGALYLDLATFADGDTVDVGGNGPWTYDSGGLGDFQNLTELQGLITAAGYDVTLIDPDGNGTDGALYIESNAVGSGANGDAITVVSAGGTYNIPDAAMAGGLDPTTTTNVVASAASVSQSGDVSLDLARNDAGTVTVSGFNNTLGENLGYDFDDTYRDSTPASTDLSVDLVHTFSYTDDQGDPVNTTQTVTWDYGVGYDPAGTDPYHGSTQSAGASDTFTMDQDGMPLGWLDAINMDDSGVMWSRYTNGFSEAIYCVGLTGFTAPAEMKRVGDNLWLQTVAAGTATVGQPGENGLGDFAPESLEGSNVDMAQEFVKMINYQRAFQANGKSITTTDDMLKTAIQMKR